ncbi:flagellar type III secretion system pore protein FliP [Musicola paradisiaca]|nr:flagellar type III secretion system pore protein FliP [Musicola paradisiaca]
MMFSAPRARLVRRSFFTILIVFFAPNSWAQLPGIISQPLANGAQSWSLPVQTLVLLTSLTFIPAVLLMMTSFTRIIIVLGLLRSALGTPTAPPNQILIGLSLFLTFFIMSPVLTKVYQDAYQPFSENKINMETAIERGSQPLRQFMLRQTRETDLALFARLAEISALSGPEAVPMRVLVPAFVTSELKTAFQIGFTIFIPFLIIDLVVASVLMALGMMMVPPATVSLPFKLMLFVLVDGWQLLLSSLVQSFYS